MDLLEILAFGLKFAEQSGAIKVAGLSACAAAISLGLKGILGYMQEENDASRTSPQVTAGTRECKST